MADDNKKVGPPDSRRINIQQPHEVAYWTKELKVDSATLKLLVTLHGTSVSAVKKALRK